jgi:hypothetical protein
MFSEPEAVKTVAGLMALAARTAPAPTAATAHAGTRPAPGLQQEQAGPGPEISP